MKHIRLATPEDAQEISGLRIGEFSRSNDFTLLAPQRLNWCETDEINPVLGVWNVENEVVATMRLVRVTHDINASEVIEADVPGGWIFPHLYSTPRPRGRTSDGRGLTSCFGITRSGLRWPTALSPF